MELTRKRSASEDSDPEAKRTKTKKQWRTPKSNGAATQNDRKVIKPGDRGIWVTCMKGKEKKSIGELYDLLEDYTERHIQRATPAEIDALNKSASKDEGTDIEKEITAEVEGIKKPIHPKLFDAVWTEVQCVVFFRTSPLVDPTSVVTGLLEEASANPSQKRTRFTQRLTPAPSIGHASEEGLEKVAREALAPHFHREPITVKKYAVRTTIRNHGSLKRLGVIKGVAALVGDPHVVDLNNPDALVLVDIMRNVCSVVVVGSEFERLKRFNLQEIFDPTPLPASAAMQESTSEAAPTLAKESSEMSVDNAT